MFSIDAEGLLYLVNQRPSGVVTGEDLLDEITSYNIDADAAQAALGDLLKRGAVHWASADQLQRPD